MESGVTNEQNSCHSWLEEGKGSPRKSRSLLKTKMGDAVVGETVVFVEGLGRNPRELFPQ